MRSGSDKRDSEILLALARALDHIERANLATQQEIEGYTGVDQTTISRAKSRKLKRVTPKVLRLKRYAGMRISKATISTDIARAAKLFYEAGGSKEELLDSIQHATRLIAGRQVRAETTRGS